MGDLRNAENDGQAFKDMLLKEGIPTRVSWLAGYIRTRLSPLASLKALTKRRTFGSFEVEINIIKHVSPCTSLYLPVSPCISMQLPVPPCISLYLPVSSFKVQRQHHQGSVRSSSGCSSRMRNQRTSSMMKMRAWVHYTSMRGMVRYALSSARVVDKTRFCQLVRLLLPNSMVCYGMLCYGLAWYGMPWCGIGMAWYVMVRHTCCAAPCYAITMLRGLC